MAEIDNNLSFDYTISELFEQAINDEQWKSDANIRKRLVNGLSKKIYNLN